MTTKFTHAEIEAMLRAAQDDPHSLLGGRPLGGLTNLGIIRQGGLEIISQLMEEVRELEEARKRTVLRNTDMAVWVMRLRDALDEIKPALGDRLLAEGPLSREYAHSVMRTIEAALSDPPPPLSEKLARVGEKLREIRDVPLMEHTRDGWADVAEARQKLAREAIKLLDEIGAGR